jgi:hypothetical protein
MRGGSILVSCPRRRTRTRADGEGFEFFAAVGTERARRTPRLNEALRKGVVDRLNERRWEKRGRRSRSGSPSQQET